MSVEKFNFDEFGKEGLPFSFTMLPNAVLQNLHDANAFAIWCYLMSKSEDWKPSHTQLCAHFKIGINKMKRIFAYLHEHFLIEYVIHRNDDGTISSTKLVVKNGKDFIKNILNKQEDDSIGTETVPMASSTGTETVPHDNHATCKKHTYKERVNTNTEKRKKRELAPKKTVATSLSDFFVPDEKRQGLLKVIAERVNVTAQFLLDKFKAWAKDKGIKSQDWQAALESWLYKERPTASPVTGVSTPSTQSAAERPRILDIQDPSHPDYERVKRLEEFRNQRRLRY